MVPAGWLCRPVWPTDANANRHTHGNTHAHAHRHAAANCHTDSNAHPHQPACSDACDHPVAS